MLFCAFQNVPIDVADGNTNNDSNINFIISNGKLYYVVLGQPNVAFLLCTKENMNFSLSARPVWKHLYLQSRIEELAFRV